MHPDASEATGGDVIEVTLTNFQRDVIDASQRMPVLVDFWAPWCQPCQALTPRLEALTVSYAGRVRLAKINSDDNPELARRFSVRGIPNVKAFVGGVVLLKWRDLLLHGPRHLSLLEVELGLRHGDERHDARFGGIGQTKQRLLLGKTPTQRRYVTLRA